jgi:hypothetical protein
MERRYRSDGEPPKMGHAMRLTFDSLHRRRRAVIASVFVIGFGAFSGRALADFENTLGLYGKTDGKQNQISYLKLVELTNTYLGNAEQVNVFVDACGSGGMLSAAAKLTMPYFIGVSRENPGQCSAGGWDNKDANPPGRLSIRPPPALISTASCLT